VTNGADARRGAAQKQARRLIELQTDPAVRNRPVELLRRRRRDHPELPQFSLRTLGGKQVPTADGELLVLASSLNAQGAAAIRAAGYRSQPVSELESKVLRVRQVGAGLVDVETLLGRLAALGAKASVNMITPSQVIMKSESTPEKAQGTPPPAPAPSPGPVRVALFDTGVTSAQRSDGWLAGLDHPDSHDPLDVLPTPNGFLDLAAGHGTFVAGVVAQVAPAADIRVHRVLDTDGVGTELMVATALVKAAQADLAQGGRLVVNLSLGTESGAAYPPVALRVALDLVQALAKARTAEVLVVAAAGNDGTTDECWPAAFQDVTAVAGLNLDRAPAPWSTHGPWVDCSALGSAVTSTYVEGREDPAYDLTSTDTFAADAWAWWTGTSFAAPQVAGAIARRAAEGGTSLAQARDALLATGQADPQYGRKLTILA
jgi:hypothetical protein